MDRYQLSRTEHANNVINIHNIVGVSRKVAGYSFRNVLCYDNWV